MDRTQAMLRAVAAISIARPDAICIGANGASSELVSLRVSFGSAIKNPRQMKRMDRIS
jgi:hypothetical protein